MKDKIEEMAQWAIDKRIQGNKHAAISTIQDHFECSVSEARKVAKNAHSLFESERPDIEQMVEWALNHPTSNRPYANLSTICEHFVCLRKDAIKASQRARGIYEESKPTVKKMAEWALDNPTRSYPHAGAPTIRDHFGCRHDDSQKASKMARKMYEKSKPTVEKMAEWAFENPTRSCPHAGLSKVIKHFDCLRDDAKKAVRIARNKCLTTHRLCRECGNKQISGFKIYCDYCLRQKQIIRKHKHLRRKHTAEIFYWTDQLNDEADTVSADHC